MSKSGRLVYESSNGDRWFLAGDGPSGGPVVWHVPNAASGGKSSFVALDAFLARDEGSPQRHAMMQLIAKIVENRDQG
jgi:hypothetical protein